MVSTHTHTHTPHSTGIVFEAYSPLGNPTRPFKEDDDPSIFDDPVIKEVAEKHKATVAQVVTLAYPSIPSALSY